MIPASPSESSAAWTLRQTSAFMYEVNSDFRDLFGRDLVLENPNHMRWLQQKVDDFIATPRESWSQRFCCVTC